MNMEKVFWQDPCLHTLYTKVISANLNELLFEKTIAYSFSGGQASDKAYINGMEVLSSRMQDTLIYYTLPSEHGLLKDQEVLMEIDWLRRYG